MIIYSIFYWFIAQENSYNIYYSIRIMTLLELSLIV